MQDNDLNIEDFKEIFIKSLFRKTVSTQEISNYFEVESRKFIKWLSNELSNENDTQRFKDILLEKFIVGIEEAYNNLSNPFIEYEQNRTWDMWEWQGKGVDISEMEKPSKYTHQIKLHKLCEKLSGVDIWLEQIEFIYEGFKLFKQQHEEDSNATAPPTNKKPQEPPKGYDLNLSVPQLETLHTKLIEGKFLDINTKLKHFKNAFNGNVLAVDFEQLKWLQEDTILSLFVALTNHKNKWKIAESVFENCDSGNLRKTFNNCKDLTIHKSNIKLFQNILP